MGITRPFSAVYHAWGPVWALGLLPVTSPGRS